MTKKVVMVGTVLGMALLLMVGCGKKEAEAVEMPEETEAQQVMEEPEEAGEIAEVEKELPSVVEEEMEDFSTYKYKFDFDGTVLFGFNIPQEYAVDMHESQSVEGYSMHHFGLYGRNIGDSDLMICTGYELTENNELVGGYSEKVQAEKRGEIKTDLGVAELYFTTVEDNYSSFDYEKLEMIEGMYDKHEEVALLNINGVTVTFWWFARDDDYKSTINEYTGQLEELLPHILKEELNEEFLTDNWDGLDNNQIEVGNNWGHIIYAEEAGTYVAAIGFNDVEGWEYGDSSAVTIGDIRYILGGGCNTSDYRKNFSISTEQVKNMDKYNFYFKKGVSSFEKYMTLQETNEVGEIDSPFGKILLYKSVVEDNGGTRENQFGIIRNNDINIWIDYVSSEDALGDILPEFFAMN